MRDGIARNTHEMKEYLTNCPAVKGWFIDGENIRFHWEGDPPTDAAEGCFFDLSAAPF